VNINLVFIVISPSVLLMETGGLPFLLDESEIVGHPWIVEK
jgi:hypothetical protein